MNTKPVDAKKLTDDMIDILKSRTAQARADDDEDRKMDRRLRMVKWSLAFFIPAAIFMVAY